MTFIIEPLNEGQEMNARTRFEGDLKQVLGRAYTIACEMTGLLPDCTITARVRLESKSLNFYTDTTWERIVSWDGHVINGLTGKRITHIWNNS